MQAIMAGIAGYMVMYENPVAGPKVLYGVTHSNHLSGRLMT